MIDTYELIDSLIAQVAALADINGLEKCRVLLDMASKLGALKAGIKNAENAHNEHIKMLSDQIQNLTTPKPLEDGETIIGGEVYHLGGDE